MKKTQILSIAVLIALITVSTVSAMDNNGQYSSREEAKKALDSAKSSGCTDESCMYNYLIKTYSNKKADRGIGDGKNFVVVYYDSPSSSKGYGSLYQCGSSQTDFLTCKDKPVMKDSYVPNQNKDSNVGDPKTSNDSQEYKTLSISDTVKENIKEQITEGIMEDIKEKIKDTHTISLKDIKEIINNRIPDEIVINGKN